MSTQQPSTQQPRPRGRRRPPADPLRKPIRPLSTISKPVQPSLHADPRSAAGDQGISLAEARQEFARQGAISLPITVSRKDLREYRAHVMRLQSSRGRIDIQDETQFPTPIRLHRRDPRAPPSGAVDEEETVEDIEESKERERMEIQREERRQIREANQAQIAPALKKKGKAFQKHTEQKYRPDDTPEAEKRRLLRYEETLPWCLEDWENRSTWVGSYEAELSDAHVMLTTAYEKGQDVIHMVPLERWYKFTAKNKFVKTNTAEEAEAMIKRAAKSQPSFLAEREKRLIKREQDEAAYNRGESHAGRLRARIGGGDDDEGAGPRRRGADDVPRVKREADADDIDFNMEEDFADDEEGLNGLFEGDEADIKDATERLKRDQLAAAAFDLRTEGDVYRQEEAEREEKELAKQLEKSLRKTLIKKEKNYDYESSDSNPYSSSSEDSEDEEELKRREEEARKAAEQNGVPADGDKVPSGASTKGANTPSGVHKAVDINKKKRPGSPNLSDASGNESARKKHKTKHLDPSRKSHLSQSGRGAASGSDSEMTDASNAKKNKQKLKIKMNPSVSGSPNGSRAGSPAASQLNGSRAGSPSALDSATAPKLMPTPLEVYKMLPKEGAPIQQTIKMFRGRIDKTNMKQFITMVKRIAVYDQERHWLTPRPDPPAE
ncbi:Rap30/74 interaction domain-containing protein [Polyplosphaeria fusca]|uniref:Rap30/74 interaction domain-containing protein n=1 Tax=Polyplosphaeria fusca TaxID=682080 RepID=A0A9P4V084_9PLEO|nr:Rap30/74 interaction domain-containing protein [Polyplosphaeria fusca]